MPTIIALVSALRCRGLSSHTVAIPCAPRSTSMPVIGPPPLQAFKPSTCARAATVTFLHLVERTARCKNDRIGSSFIRQEIRFYRRNGMSKLIPYRAVAIALAAFAMSFACLGQVGTFPDRPIKFVVPYGPGGTVDPTARALAQRVSEILNVPVVVENKPGAAGSIGTEFAIRQPPDGYTVLVHTNVVASEPPLKPKLAYNFQKDMTPLITIDETPFVVLVHPSLPVNSIKELVDYAKANPGKLNYGAS